MEGGPGCPQGPVQLENDTDYEVYVDDMAVGSMMTNMSGKLSVTWSWKRKSGKVSAVKTPVNP